MVIHVGFLIEIQMFVKFFVIKTPLKWLKIRFQLAKLKTYLGEGSRSTWKGVCMGSLGSTGNAPSHKR